MKKCGRCKETLSNKDFNRGQAWCRECYADYYKERKNNGKTGRTYEEQRNVNLWQKYGIDSNTYNEMYTLQNGKCALCGKEGKSPASGVPRIEILVVDHCHKSTRVRGLLCQSCNLMVGHIEKSRSNLEAIFAYLEEE